MSRGGNPYQPGTYGATPWVGGSGFTLGPQSFGGFGMNAAYVNGPMCPSSGSGHLRFPDTQSIIRIQCFKCKSYGHYANECPY
jgi:hypothetical protein